MASFPSYSLAKRHADGLVKDLAKGSQVTALHPAQARDALAALEWALPQQMADDDVSQAVSGAESSARGRRNLR
jgi:hypothetical protein